MPSQPPTGSTPSPDPSGPLWKAVGIALLLAVYVVVVVRTAWLSDDSYITFRTIDNFVGGFGLRWNIAERVQAYTHPLWMLVLTPLYAMTREIYLTALLTSVAMSVAAFTLLAWTSHRRHVEPVLTLAGLGVLILSRAFVDYSTSGLENPLTHLLLVSFLLSLPAGQPASSTRLIVLSLIAGLATLNRMDTLLLFAPALAWHIWRSWSRRALAILLLGFAPFLVWEVFAVAYYGFPFPNTAYAKLRTGIPQFEYWMHGISYFKDSLWRDPITLVAIAGGVGIAMSRRHPNDFALIGGLLLYLIYIVQIGGDFMTGRFFAAPLLVAVSLVVAYPAKADVKIRILAMCVLPLGLLGATPTPLSGSNYGSDHKGTISDIGIADERAFYYPTTGLLNGIAATAKPLSATADQGRNSRLNRDPLVVTGTVGFPGFLAGPNTHLVDYHALGDPLLARLPMPISDPFFKAFCLAFVGRPCSTSWRTGHYLRQIPTGYLDSLLENSNLLPDDSLHQLYDALRQITRDPIWSMARWGTIIRMNLGYYDALLPTTRVEYEAIQFTEMYERHPEVPSASLLSGALGEYLQSGQQEKANECRRKLIAIYKNTLQRNPENESIRNQLGMTLESAGEIEEAINLYRQTLQINPASLDMRRSLALALVKARKTDEALSEFQAIARLTPDVAAAHNDLGSVLFELGNLDLAIAEYSQALRLDPQFAPAHSNLARSLFRAGRTKDAIGHFRQSLQLKADDSVTHNDLGVALAESGSLDEALEQFQEALRLAPNYEDARNNLEETTTMKRQKADTH